MDSKMPGTDMAGDDAGFSHQELFYTGFLSIAEFRDAQTSLHLERVAAFARILAEEVADDPNYPQASDETWREHLVQAAPLHDVGKIATPDRILLKPGKLTPSEFEIMKAHTTAGRSILEDMARRFPQGVHAAIEMGIELAAYHHERWDGRGYPEGLQGPSIPLSARIMALSDVYDAVTSPRVYRPGRFSHDEAVAFVQANRGTMFDPRLADAFLSIEKVIHSEAQRLKDPVSGQRRKAAGANHAPSPPASILVVDDEPTILDVMEEYLSMAGYRVRTAANVEEARLRLKADSFDLVTLDINMPGESGLTLLEELAPRAPDTLVIMMTALADVHVGVEAVKKGAHDYLVKPVDLDELVLAVERALHHREVEQENRAYLTRLELTVAHRTEQLRQRIRTLEGELARLRGRPG